MRHKEKEKNVKIRTTFQTPFKRQPHFCLFEVTCTQLTQNVKTTSYERRCDVIRDIHTTLFDVICLLGYQSKLDVYFFQGNLCYRGAWPMCYQIDTINLVMLLNILTQNYIFIFVFCYLIRMVYLL